MINKIRIALLVIIVGVSSSEIVHAEGGGLRVNINKYQLYIEYNDNGHDRISGMEYVRDPSGLVFDIIALLQSNSGELSKTSAEYFVQVGNVNKYVSISKNKPSEESIFYIEKIETLDKKLFRNELCKIITSRKCGVIKDKVALYISDKSLYSDSSDLIEVGCFPCSNKRIYAISDRFSSTESESKPPVFKKIIVTRKTIARYIRKLPK